MRVAVLGMGSMGQALAERLLAGCHDVTVWNRTPDRTSDLVAAGASEAATPAEAAARAQATFTSLADDDAVRAVVGGSDGAAAGLREGVLVDASTVSPGTTAELAQAVDARFLASPILGAPTAVASGQARYLIGGPRALYEQLAPVFDTLADEQGRRYLGEDAGLATTLKLLSNYLLMAGIATLAEAVAAAQAAGLSNDLIRDYFGELPLVAPALRNRLDDIVAGDHDGWFSTTLGAKDVRLAVELARSHGVHMVLADAVQRRYQDAAAAGWPQADIGAVVELLRRDA